MEKSQEKPRFERNRERRPVERPPRQPYSGTGRITALSPQKINSNRYNVFVDEEYAFSVSDKVLIDYGLKLNLVLSPELAAELQATDLYHQGLDTALALIAFRPRSEAEITTRLRQKYPSADAAVLSRVTGRLRELNYINDEDFARFWVDSRTNGSPRGRKLIEQELLQKGVAKPVISAALQTLQQPTEDDEEGRSLEEQQALEAARKKAHTYAAEDWNGFYRKLGSFLLRRGYDFEISGRITKQVWQEVQEDEAEDE